MRTWARYYCRFWMGALIIFPFVVVLAACDPILSPQRAATPTQPPAPTVHELTKDQIRACIYEGGNQTLEPSPIFATSGDMRPVWIVTGKVENRCEYALKSVKIRITAYNKANRADILDTADLTVDDVPARSVRAYKRDIQLIVQRQQQFAFYYEFVTVTAAFLARPN